VNGLQNHTDTETEKSVSDDNTVDSRTLSVHDGKKKTAADKNSDSDTNDSSSSDNEEDKVEPVQEPRPAKVIAGEVIKQWQTKTRSKGFFLRYCSLRF